MYFTQTALLFPWLRLWALPFACAFFLAILLTGLLVRIAATTGWVAGPQQEIWKQRVVTQFGGLPILLAFSLASLFLSHTHETRVLLLLTWGMAAAGLAGELLGLHPILKLVCQILMAGVAVHAGILQVVFAHFWWDAAFTVFWVVAITNATMLLDSMDGLAAGVAIIASVQMIVFAAPAPAIIGLTLCMIASLAGYLFYNFSPAKVSMGNVGTFAIGFFLACTSIKTAEHLSSLGSVLIVPCTVLFIPIFDTLLVTITRRTRGRAISRRARDHTSHRLVLAGLSERQAVGLLYAIAIISGMMAFLEKSYWAPEIGAGIVALFLIAATLLWVYLAKVQVPSKWLPQSGAEVSASSQFLPQLVTPIAAIVFDAFLIALGLYFAFLIRSGRMNQVLYGRFLFASALSMAIKLPLLVVFGAYKTGWEIRGRKDIYPILKAVAWAAVCLAAISAILPQPKPVGIRILLLDALLTSSLLVLVRTSTAILDEFFSMTRFSARNANPHAGTARPKLIRIIGRLNGGGPARQACLLHERLADQFETYLVTGRLDQGEQDMSYLLSSERNVFRLEQMSRKISPWADAFAFWKLLKFLARVKPDIVHTHTAKAGALGRLAAWLVGVPVIVHTYHGNVFHGYFGPLKTRFYLGIERLLAHFSTQIITVSGSQRQDLCVKYHVAPPENIVVIHNGVELERFFPPRHEEARKTLGLPQDAFVAVWAGRMVPIKDVQLLAKLIHAAESKGNIYFLVVGEGTEKHKLESLIRVCRNVRILGWRQDIEQIWFAADVAILTSRNEGTPTTLVEAMAAGVPFVATEVGGVRDLAVPPLRELPDSLGHEAANGFLTARRPEALLHCIEQIAADCDLKKRMGAVGHEFVNVNFSLPRMVQETRLLYEDLLARSDHRAAVAVPEEHASHAGDSL
ncbi:MAG TPA: glycosyltransferase [Candidatus Angelobacter sp.]